MLRSLATSIIEVQNMSTKSPTSGTWAELWGFRLFVWLWVCGFLYRGKETRWLNWIDLKVVSWLAGFGWTWYVRLGCEIGCNRWWVAIEAWRWLVSWPKYDRNGGWLSVLQTRLQEQGCPWRVLRLLLPLLASYLEFDNHSFVCTTFTLKYIFHNFVFI